MWQLGICSICASVRLIRAPSSSPSAHRHESNLAGAPLVRGAGGDRIGLRIVDAGGDDLFKEGDLTRGLRCEPRRALRSGARHGSLLGGHERLAGEAAAEEGSGLELSYLGDIADLLRRLVDDGR